MQATDPSTRPPATDAAEVLPDDPYAVTRAAASGDVVAADPIDTLVTRQRWLRLAIVTAPVAWLLAWSINWSVLVMNPASAAFAAPWLVALALYALVTVQASAQVAWLTGLHRSAGVGLACLALVPLVGLVVMAVLHARANRVFERHGFATRWHGPLF